MRSTSGSEAGQSLVEFAIASSMLFAVLFGIFGFGIAVYRYNLVSNLAQEGARWASVRGSNAASPVVPATAADVQTYVRGRSVGLNTSITVATTTVDVSNACTATSVDPSTLAKGTAFCVTVTHDFTPMSSFIPNATLHLRSRAQMRMAR
jgi:Flp pilus assembly protein TadG